jgi:hypothetical protein
VTRDASGRATKVRYVLPRHKATNWAGSGRSRTSTRPGANGVVDLSPFEFLDRFADLVPPPRKYRHRYHGVFAPNHKLRRAVTALAIGTVSGNLIARKKAAQVVFQPVPLILTPPTPDTPPYSHTQSNSSCLGLDRTRPTR